LILAFVVFNSGDLYYLGYNSLKNNNNNKTDLYSDLYIFVFVYLYICIADLYIYKVVTSEALGPGSVLMSRERRENLREEECL